MTVPPITYPGSRWWKFDFHTHTPASTDTPWHTQANTPEALTAEMWLLKYMGAGIDCVAVTDHNSGAWIDNLKSAYAAMEQSRPEGFREIHLFPGVELSVNGGFHLLAIFDKIATTSDIDCLLVSVGYTGAKGDSDGVTRESPVKVIDAILAAGGIPIPAHVDQLKGLLRSKQGDPGKCELDANTVRQLLEHPHLMAMEVVNDGFTPPSIYSESRIHWARVVGTDCHNFRPPYPQTPGSRFTWVKMGIPSLEALRLALHDGNDFSLIRSDAVGQELTPNGTPEHWIESLEITNARLMGLGAPALFSFSPWMNSIIGGRGSGKSTLVHFIRLASKRGEDLARLGDETRNRVLKNFNSFCRSAGGRAQDAGGLRDDTSAVLIYHKGGSRFRLTWLASDRGTTVEEWDDCQDEWMPSSSQDVVERFPLRTFSQDEIGLIAERPEALLARVDESIAKADWQARWNETENRFFSLVTRIRALRSRLAEKDRLTGQLQDLIKQLAAFEKSEHAKVRKDYQRVNRQEREIYALFEAFEELAEGIGNLNNGFLLHDIPEDLIDPENPTEASLGEVNKALHAAAARASRILEQVRTAMISTAHKQRDLLKTSPWIHSKIAAEEAHLQLIETLKNQGIEDPAAFVTLVAKRQAVEKALKEIEGVEKEISILTEDAIKCRDHELLELRSELREMRRDFLIKELGGNHYVRIALNPFGDEEDKDRVERELRRLLGCEDTRFADAMRDTERRTGFVEELYTQLPADEEKWLPEILNRISDWKQQVFNAGRGRASNLPVRFQTFIANQCKARPEFLDRLLVWWPEDSLVVSYSRGGDGKNFVPLTTGSAGEKAAALLAFFLAHGDVPLVLDQPENDLDNHLITDLVVKQLRENKKRRQIIVVTHNPNIVVNGDTEMVHAMNFAGGQCRAKSSGALQNEEVRTEVCEVMEGGRAALQSRFQRLI